MELTHGKINDAFVAKLRTDMNRNPRVKAISENALAQLQLLAGPNDGLNTETLRALLGYSRQQWQRFTASDDFPHIERIHGRGWVNPRQVLEFCKQWNRMARSLNATEIAKLLGCTTITVRRLAKLPGFPPVIGISHGVERRDLDAMLEWHAARLGGATMPPTVDVTTKPPRQKRAPKGPTHGKPTRKNGQPS